MHPKHNLTDIKVPDILLRSYTESDFASVKALWVEAFPNDSPWNAAEVAIPAKLLVHPDLFLVALQKGELAGSVMAGYDGHRGWISRVAVFEKYRGQNIGKTLIAEAEQRLAALGCVKINLQVVEANAAVVEFYKSCGFQIEPRISMSKLLA